jgi:Tat protein translocase TatB subunit
MFDLGIQEIIVIFIVALIALGPERLPEAGRKLGKLIGGFKAALYDVKSQISTEMHTDFNPLKDSLNAFNKDVVEEVRNLDKPAVKNDRLIDGRVNGRVDARIDARIDGRAKDNPNTSDNRNNPGAPNTHNSAATGGAMADDDDLDKKGGATPGVTGDATPGAGA